MAVIVENPYKITRRWSVKIAAFGSAFMGGWTLIQGLGLTSTLPLWAPQAVAAIIFFGGFVAAYLKQPNIPDSTAAPVIKEKP